MPPKRVGGRAHHRRDLLLVRDVDLDRERVARAQRDRLLGRLAIDVGDADLRALVGEQHRRLAAHAAARAGDHRDLAVEPSHQHLRREEHVLDLRVAVERLHPELAAEAGLLEAAERRRDAHRAVRVHREHAGLERPRDAQRPRAVARPDRAGEPVRRVVRDPRSPRPRPRTGSPRRPGRRPPRARRGRRSSPRRACTGTSSRGRPARCRGRAARRRRTRRPSRGAAPRSAGPSPWPRRPGRRPGQTRSRRSSSSTKRS